MLARCAITFDVDWAPDWAIELCAALCRARGIPATFFVTDASPFLAALRQDPLFEVGLHPNFLPGSSHGKTFEEVMDFSLGLVPEARSMRTHDLFGCSSLFELIARRYGQIQVDASLFLPGRSCEPVILYHGEPPRRFVRVPFRFADNVAARSPGWRWDAEPVIGDGLTVFDFHPSHIALNLVMPDAYTKVKSAMGNRPLHAATRGDFAPLVNHGAGAHTYLKRLLEALTAGECATIHAFAAAHGGADRKQA
jgi:hypothetical protein